jgi:hypothetical protein
LPTEYVCTKIEVTVTFAVALNGVAVFLDASTEEYEVGLG